MDRNICTGTERQGWKHGRNKDMNKGTRIQGQSNTNRDRDWDLQKREMDRERSRTATGTGTDGQ